MPDAHPLTALLPRTPGTYALVFEVSAPLRLSIGRLGGHTLAAGLYIYLGSALGPGGLKARVGRHLRRDKKPHWHIDAMTTAAPIIEVWAVESSERLECRWSSALLDLPGTHIPVPGFGASDCACETHLLQIDDPLAARNMAATTTVDRGLLYWPLPRSL